MLSFLYPIVFLPPLSPLFLHWKYSSPVLRTPSVLTFYHLPVVNPFSLGDHLYIDKLSTVPHIYI